MVLFVSPNNHFLMAEHIDYQYTRTVLPHACRDQMNNLLQYIEKKEPSNVPHYLRIEGADALGRSSREFESFLFISTDLSGGGLCGKERKRNSEC